MAAGIGLTTVLQQGGSAVALLDSISFSRSMETVDATALDSANSGETVIAGIKRWGECTFEGNWDGATQQATLFTNHANRTDVTWKIVFPTTVDSTKDTLNFTGYLTSLSISATTTDKMRISGTIKISSQPTLDAS